MTQKTQINHVCARCGGFSHYLVRTLINFTNSKGHIRREKWVHPYFGGCFITFRETLERQQRELMKQRGKIKTLEETVEGLVKSQSL